jgi:hypothetical protein
MCSCPIVLWAHKCLYSIRVHILNRLISSKQHLLNKTLELVKKTTCLKHINLDLVHSLNSSFTQTIIRVIRAKWLLNKGFLTTRWHWGNKGIGWVLCDVFLPYYFSNYSGFQIGPQNLMILGVRLGFIDPPVSERGWMAFLGCLWNILEK